MGHEYKPGRYPDRPPTVDSGAIRLSLAVLESDASPANSARLSATSRPSTPCRKLSPSWGSSRVTDFAAPEEPSVVRPPATPLTLREEADIHRKGAPANNSLDHALHELSERLCSRMDRMEHSLANSFQNMLEAAFPQATDPTPTMGKIDTTHSQCQHIAQVVQPEVPLLLDGSADASNDLMDDHASGEDTSRASTSHKTGLEEPGDATLAAYTLRRFKREESMSQTMSRAKSLPELGALSIQQDIAKMQNMRSTRGLEDGSAKLLLNEKSPFQRFIFQPTSRTVLLWSLIGPVMLFYDVLMVPLSVFPLPDHWVMEAISVGGTTYWTIDTLRGFVTGYEMPNNQVEMRPGEIAFHYLTTWFLLDMMTCAMDWVLYFTDSGDMFNKFWRMGRALQAWKLMHPSRLMRVLRMCKRITENSPMIHDIAVHTKLAMKMFNMIFVCVILCHYMACNWYNIGKQETPSWVQESGLEDTTDVVALYSKCFLWGLAQSGFATSDLYAINTNERIYTCLVGLAWMMVICVIINFFNHCMLQLREMDIDREKEGMLITKYLAEHNVSQAVRLQVHRYFRVRFATYRPRVHEQEIKFFKDVPLALQIQLHQELYMPILEVHPFFSFLQCISNRILAMLCHIAMHETHVWTNQVIFKDGATATHTWHVLVGRCQYFSLGGEVQHSTLSCGDWICEAAMWMNWKCQGRLIACCSGELVGIDAEKFAALLRNTNLEQPKHADYIQAFGDGVCQHFLHEDPRTDIWDMEEIRKISHEVAKDMELPHRRPSAPHF